jgi:hypothetical protein
MSGHNGILERTGGQVFMANFFGRHDLPSCVQEKICFKFGRNYLTNCGGLTFFFAGNESYIH